MTTMEEYFARLDSQRQPIRLALKDLSAERLWARPEHDEWSIGETLQHLAKMMRLFRRLSKVALVLERPFAKARRHRPFPESSRDLFSGRSLRAPLLVRPGGPGRSPGSEAVMRDLERESELFKDALAGEQESVLGHTWLWDPIMGAQNLLQVVDLLALHEEHHFEIVRKRWPQYFQPA